MHQSGTWSSVVLRLALVPGRHQVHRAGGTIVENPELAGQPLSRLQAAACRQRDQAFEPFLLEFAPGQAQLCRSPDVGMRRKKPGKLCFDQIDQPQRP